MQQRMSAFAYRTLRHADWSLPAPMDGSRVSCAGLRSAATAGEKASADDDFTVEDVD